jgi:hypothetical protein
MAEEQKENWDISQMKDIRVRAKCGCENTFTKDSGYQYSFMLPCKEHSGDDAFLARLDIGDSANKSRDKFLKRVRGEAE